MNSYFGGKMRTGDFQDKNGNGTDDRDEGNNFVDTDKDGLNDRQQQSDPSADFQRIQRGYQNYGSLSDQLFRPVDKDNDRINDLQTGIAFDQLGKNFDQYRSEQMANFQSGQFKDNSKFGADLELRNNREMMGDQFAYTQRDKDKTFELTDEFQNREFGRDIGMLAASSEQNRKNYRAQGVETRLGYITQGEQNRLQAAAEGDQSRRGMRVFGDETRKTDSNKADEDRKTYDFEDNINARGEARNKSRALSLARGF
jgi:hypothetical protein